MSAKLFGDRWENVGSLNEGGQGRIFLVQDRTGKETGELILKRLKNLNRIERFKKEIEASKKLDHPNIARIIDYSFEKDPYFVSPFYPKGTLSSRSPFSVLEALNIFEIICAAVSYAHKEGVVHRDLKPENICFDSENQPVIIDFGLCYFIDEKEKRLTTTTEQVGTRSYMAPELEGGRCKEIVPSMDYYSLGKILYFMMSGKNVVREHFIRENSLESILSNPQLGYITERILSRTITTVPSSRINPVETIGIIKIIKRLIMEHIYPGKVGSRCRFCGEGNYEALPRILFPPKDIRGGNKDVLTDLLICPKCRNLQMFEVSAENSGFL
jgi:serine/threonine protein kinase